MSTPETPFKIKEFQQRGLVGKTFSDPQLDHMHDVIVNGAKVYNRMMPERLFVGYFLPVLSGQEENEDKLREYIAGAGGTHIGVNIVNDAGEFLFEAPPFFNSEHITCLPEDKNAPTFSQVADSVELLRHRSPRQAENVFQSAMIRRFIQAHEKNYKPTVNESRWIEIFNRYGVQVTNKAILSKENNVPSLSGSDTQASSAGDQADIQTIGEF